ncbi:cytochrome C oxidase subunit IV family protein [Mycobacterium kansasii]|uniref:cytochrome C oxidase subunit IV family protein n=1 Tax=Mycobacterium kansasii TaxID=1768 RepID=UPI0004F75B1A|nr:cytochrome C oxidase subunit IV family protein [Mycobacterium kansasii]ARG57672.1 hypothetical protein B1T43_19455 [Mycobacterium kansasii]ARG63174.1 hypothetical protein B1T45_19860 [Mycobacterium kansasii]ARG70809.1 hypothetical protein B1T47_19190 [Mycobacterium kansasii]ARG74615.1 hypothetical protein B1T51_09135 [Mycobacterium kansasii]ARG80092.1 hypothetical protein B1T52_09335 [Mycobacterium kansasii]
MRFNKRLLVVWVVLASLTFSYLWFDYAVDGTPKAGAVITSSVIVIALIKVRIIFREFMEVRQSPAMLRHLTDACVLVVGAALLGSYLVGMMLH